MGVDEAVDEEPEMQGEGVGLGGGGGGGGAAMARPVAVISVGPNGVQVEPVVDPTKIAIAFFTTLGSMFFKLSRMVFLKIFNSSFNSFNKSRVFLWDCFFYPGKLAGRYFYIFDILGIYSVISPAVFKQGLFT